MKHGISVFICRDIFLSEKILTDLPFKLKKQEKGDYDSFANLKKFWQFQKIEKFRNMSKTYHKNSNFCFFLVSFEKRHFNKLKTVNRNF